MVIEKGQKDADWEMMFDYFTDFDTSSEQGNIYQVYFIQGPTVLQCCNN